MFGMKVLVCAKGFIHSSLCVKRGVAVRRQSDTEARERSSLGRGVSLRVQQGLLACGEAESQSRGL